MRVGRFIFALLLITFGVMTFMINLGYGSWASFAIMGKWWPLILIIVGLGMFWHGRLPQLVAYALAVLAVAGVVGYMMTDNSAWPFDFMNSSSEQRGTQEILVSKDYRPDLKQGQLKINFGGGRLNMEPGNQAWFQGHINSGLRTKSIEADNDTLRVALKGHEGDFWQPNANRNNDRVWSLKLAPELNWRIDANIGAVAANLDLSNVSLSEMDCDMGAGALNLNLGNNGPFTKLDISGGASSIKLRVPAAVGVKVSRGAALTSDNLDELGWSKNGNTYLSPNYDQAASRIDLDLHLGAGSFEIQPY